MGVIFSLAYLYALPWLHLQTCSSIKVDNFTCLTTVGLDTEITMVFRGQQKPSCTK